MTAALRAWDLRGPTPRLATGAEAARLRLLALLDTRPGERVGLPDYGCRIHELAGRPLGAAELSLARFLIQEAIERWLPEWRDAAVELSLLEGRTLSLRADAPARIDWLLDLDLGEGWREVREPG